MHVISSVKGLRPKKCFFRRKCIDMRQECFHLIGIPERRFVRMVFLSRLLSRQNRRDCIICHVEEKIFINEKMAVGKVDTLKSVMLMETSNMAISMVIHIEWSEKNCSKKNRDKTNERVYYL